MRPRSAPEYVSERLILRRFVDGDASFALEVHSTLELRRFVPSVQQESLDEALTWIRTNASTRDVGRGWWCVTLHDGTPVGAVVLKPIRYSEGLAGDEVEIGWRWHPAHMGRGYATEAAELLLAAGLAGGLDRIIAVVDPDNLASQAVCERIGMRAAGETTRYYDCTLRLFEASVGPGGSRQVAWRGVDDPSRRDSADVCLGDGLRAFGRQETDAYAAAWEVDARDGWVTAAVNVAVSGDGWRRTLALSRDAESGQWEASTYQEGRAPEGLSEPGIVDGDALGEALDCDLGLCPLTNTMPIRRLHLQTEHVDPQPMTMAWIHMPSLQVTASPQEYAGAGPDSATCTSGTRQTTYTLELDPDGLVVTYPGLAERADL